MSYVTQFNQNVVVDSANSSTANLAPNAFFIGTPVSTLGVAGIQVQFFSDQPCTVWVEQSMGAVSGVGTVTTTNPGSVGTITGVSTKFTRDFKVGDQIMIVGEAVRYIASITSDTVMTANATFATVSGAAYTFYPWDLSDRFRYDASTNFGKTTQAISAYERVRVTNIGTATSLIFRLNTALCPIVESLPRSLDANGYLKVNSGADHYNFMAENTPQGERRVAAPYRIVGKQFDFYGVNGAPDPNFWSTYTLNSATIAVAGSVCTLTSGTNSAGNVVLTSIRRGRYIQGCSMRFRANIQLGDTGIASNTRRWGACVYANYAFTVSVGTAAIGNVYTVNSQQFTCYYINGATVYCYGTGAPSASGTLTFNSGPGSGNLTYTAFASVLYPTDGAYFKLSGTTLSVCTLKAGVETAVASGSFNGDLGASYSPTTSNTVYEIYWTNGKVYFAVGDSMLHTVTASSATWSNFVHLGCFMDNINSGNTASVTLGSRSMGVARLGLPDTAPKVTYIAGAVTAQVLKSGVGKIKSIIIGDTTSNATVILYDAIVAVNTIASFTLKNGASPPQPVLLDFDFYNGLCITTTGTPQVTIIYE